MYVNNDTWLSEDGANERRAQLKLDQLALALRSIEFNHWLIPVFAGVICLLFRRWIGTAQLLGWLAMVAVSVVPLAVVAGYFAKKKPKAADAQRWVIAVSAGFFFAAAAWASLSFLLWQPHSDLNHMIVLLLLAVTLAGSAAMLSTSIPLAAIAFVLYGGALVLAPLQEGGEIYNGLSLLALLYIGYFAHMAKQVHKTARDMLLLRNDKNDLIMALASAKVESDTARTHAEAASVAKSQFLANMSHELRTPLNAILGFSEIISTDVMHGDRSKDREYADLIHTSGQHLLTLINDILDLAKIEAGKLVLRESEIDLDRLIDELQAFVAPKAAAGHCMLAKRIPADFPHILGDERAIKQILLNLLSNAVKFTLPGGAVTAFARLEQDGRAAFGVADTGVGIAPEDQTLVFQKFGQGRHDIVTADKGTGLGLPIVKGLVEAHGGSVVLESRLAEGTIVTVTLPASRVLSAPLQAVS